MPWVRSKREYLVRLELDQDEFGRATMTKTFFAWSAAEARELARLECGLTWREALQKLTVKPTSA